MAGGRTPLLRCFLLVGCRFLLLFLFCVDLLVSVGDTGASRVNEKTHTSGGPVCLVEVGTYPFRSEWRMDVLKVRCMLCVRAVSAREEKETASAREGYRERSSGMWFVYRHDWLRRRVEQGEAGVGVPTG